MISLYQTTTALGLVYIFYIVGQLPPLMSQNVCLSLCPCIVLEIQPRVSWELVSTPVLVTATFGWGYISASNYQFITLNMKC